MKTGIQLLVSALVLFTVSCTASDKNKSRDFDTENKTTYRQPVKTSTARKSPTKKKSPLANRGGEIYKYANAKGYSTKYCFLIDMSIPSGRDRFFIYDLEKRSVVYSGLVAHGSCNERFISQARFSNANNSGCSSMGRYKVGSFYRGKYGKSFRLHGLDNSNSNAYQRAVVIHGYECVPDDEIYPRVLCNSLGCPGVSYNFFNKLSRIIQNSDKPILLWVYR